MYVPWGLVVCKWHAEACNSGTQSPAWLSPGLAELPSLLTRPSLLGLKDWALPFATSYTYNTQHINNTTL